MARRRRTDKEVLDGIGKKLVSAWKLQGISVDYYCRKCGSLLGNRNVKYRCPVCKWKSYGDY